MCLNYFIDYFSTNYHRINKREHNFALAKLIGAHLWKCGIFPFNDLTSTFHLL